MQAYRTFYTNQGGPETAFTFVSPFDDVTYTVRFEGNLQITFQAAVFSVKFAFRVVTA
jgi:hypothetical protein